MKTMSIKKAAMTAALVIGFAGFSVAAEPLVLKPAEKIEFNTEQQKGKADDDAKTALVLTAMIAAGLGAAYMMTRKRSMFGDEPSGDRNEDDCWKD